MGNHGLSYNCISATANNVGLRWLRDGAQVWWTSFYTYKIRGKRANSTVDHVGQSRLSRCSYLRATSLPSGECESIGNGAGDG